MFDRQVLICINVSDWLGTCIYIYIHTYLGTYHIMHVHIYIYIYIHIHIWHTYIVYLFKTFCTHIYLSIYLSYLIYLYTLGWVIRKNWEHSEGCSRWMDCRNRLLEGSCDARLLRDRSRGTAPSQPSRCASWWGTVIEVIWLEMGCLKIIGSPLIQ